MKDITLEHLESSYNNFNIYTASTISTKDKYLVKTTKELLSSKSDILALEHEFNILSELQHKYILKPIESKINENRFYIYFEHFNGFSLKQFFNNINNNSLTKFLSVVLQILDVLNYLHKKRIIHNGISLNSILITKDLKEIRLINFENSFYLDRAKPIIQYDTSIYTAPEQTSRIDLDINEKTDIYSLGIVLYELLIGEVSSDIHQDEFTYNIIAKELENISDLNITVPIVLSKIITKMVAKDPQDRYDSTLSLYLDIKRVSDELIKFKKVDDFEIDTFKQDFLIGNKNLFFGRDEQISSFLNNFKNETDKNKLFIVSGISGIGKTTFINKGIESFKKKSNLIEVKFDNYKQYIPYKVLFSSFSSLIKKILIKDESELIFWKNRILVALGNETQVLFEFIPELKKLIGELNGISKLGPIDSKIRFNNVFVKFIQLFASKKEPLVVFLDDMQWADKVTIEWLDSMLQRVSFLKVIITYRDNEVSKNSLLYKKLQEIDSFDIEVYRYKLDALTSKNIEEMIDSNISIEDSKTFANIIYNKTDGNAFYIVQFIKDLLFEKILYFDEEKCEWKYNLQKLKKLNSKNTITQFLEKRVSTLSDNEIKLLQIASCIGNIFTYEILKEVSFLEDNFDVVLNHCYIKSFMKNQRFHLILQLVWV